MSNWFTESLPFLFDKENNNQLFDWAGEGLFGLIGGAAAGAGAYYSAKHEEKMYKRRQRDRDERYKASAVSMDDYGHGYHSLTGGMLTGHGYHSLTGGMLTGHGALAQNGGQPNA